MTKKEITNILNNLHGWICKTFNSHKKMPKGAIGFVDYVLINPIKKKICFIEMKGKGDGLSEKQSSFKNACERIASESIEFYYFLLTEENYQEIIKEITSL